MAYSVYKLTFPNGKVYIGITSLKPEKRWANGYGYLGKKDGEYTQPLMARAILKYGWENVEHEIIYSGLNKEDACDKEIELIAKYQSNNRTYGYNIGNGGVGTISFSKETLNKMSEAKKGEKNPWYGKHINHPMYGKHHSEEWKRERSIATMGEKNPSYGKHRSDDTRAKMSEAHKKRDKEGIKKKVHCIEMDVIYSSITDASKQTGINKGNISSVCNGKMETAGGFHWEFVE